ncbi:hypothetical protein C5Y96_11375 [Blastopirellula marina]|uniref:Uncharacterized protein n=1 Tax=Blastopirellula marina TaxID=124 RepID=A0A2S8FMU3_9BACT|nr:MULTISPECIES: hypothetical protein [Pirellulaceae]PQO33437.1 hypothetical protein C5Y96_11375 [Blastopirellula marina]RCS52527.1 hypothetical protein DTL36_11385 [Bremerella cremea]
MNRSELLPASLNFVEESHAEATGRYQGFGQDFFSELYNQLPSLARSFTFYRNTDGTDDLWAICQQGPIQFGVQLDPDIEVICVWDKTTHEEIGTWQPQPIPYAIDWIKCRRPINLPQRSDNERQ